MEWGLAWTCSPGLERETGQWALVRKGQPVLTEEAQQFVWGVAPHLLCWPLLYFVLGKGEGGGGGGGVKIVLTQLLQHVYLFCINCLIVAKLYCEFTIPIQVT